MFPLAISARICARRPLSSGSNVTPSSVARLPELRRVGQQERPAAVVDEPLGAVPGLERIERQAVRLEVILLRVVHRDEQVLRAGSPRDDSERHEGKQAPRPAR